VPAKWLGGFAQVLPISAILQITHSGVNLLRDRLSPKTANEHLPVDSIQKEELFE
jgi:hypothetical protein